MNTIVWLGVAFAVVALLVLAARSANRGGGGADVGYSGGSDGHASHDSDAGGSDGGGCDGGGDGGD